jgi:hypothetical protein
MKVKELKKQLKGLDNCDICVRSYDEWGNPHLNYDFEVEVRDSFVGFLDPDETRIVIISPEYDFTDETLEGALEGE